MQSTELSLEIAAQELTDPNTVAADLIEFDDLNAILEPLPSANDTSPRFPGEPEIEVELELAAEEIDALLSNSGKIQV